MFDFPFSVRVRLGNRTYRTWEPKIRIKPKINRPEMLLVCHQL